MEKASTADMVKDAIKTLGERTGSSLHNIKKYIEAVYKVDMRYRAPRIRKFLRTAVGDGVVLQTRGRGASGSFKMPPKQPSASAANKAASKATSKAPRISDALPVAAAGAKKTNSRTTSTARKASGTTVSTTSMASRTTARSAVSASTVSTASTASTRSAKSRARRL